MANRWFPSDGASALNPLLATTGGSPHRPPPLPPDPLDDPTSPLLINQFPPLATKSSTTSPSPSETAPIEESTPLVTIKSIATDPQTADIDMTEASQIAFEKPRSTVPNLRSEISDAENYNVVPPKNSSPLQTNRASSMSHPPSNPLTPTKILATTASEKTSPYSQIQSVLSPMWGRRRHVEFHNNPLTRSMLVRIPSPYLRLKILEKGIWYVGDSMFHTAQWSPNPVSETFAPTSIPIWAHLRGVPPDLRHWKRLRLVAGLVGEPVETDDITKNLAGLTLSHVKVHVDLTKDLPRIVEFERQNSQIVELNVDYPWLPSTCSTVQSWPASNDPISAATPKGQSKYLRKDASTNPTKKVVEKTGDASASSCSVPTVLTSQAPIVSIGHVFKSTPPSAPSALSIPLPPGLCF
ncbi:uncharacterized protein LOC112089684 [Eutrema salsugineum]|uniref:uncharacterized protein LOC112089684 n=1 Tax=Eutrema salsugineum TaxID=72664 RepID=UPI000CED5305|nr:uncharacterized protein LOC112089684 [Eutrema salsugineum]